MDIPEDIIERVGMGDEQAYAELFQQSWEHAVRTCWLILRNKYDAEEAAQEAFLKLYLHRRDIRDIRTFRAWFYRILTNSALDRARRSKRHSDISEIQVANPVSGIQRAEDRMQIREAMERLAVDERIAVVLVYFNGLTENEAAQVAGWKLGKLKYRLNHARRILARSIVDGYEQTNMNCEGGIQHV